MLDSSIFWFSFNFLSGFVYFLLFRIIADCSSKKRTPNTIINLILILVALISFMTSFYNLLICMIFSTIFYKINYDERTIKCVAFSVIYWGIIYQLIECVSRSLFYMIDYTNMFEDEVISATVIYFEGLIIKLLILIVLAIIYIVKLHKFKTISDIFMFIPVVTNILSLLLIFKYMDYNRTIYTTSILELIIISSLTIISNICFFILIKKIISGHKIKYENKILVDNILKESDYYLNISKEKDKVKEIYHDMKNHMICIRDICESNNPQKAVDYIDNIETQFKKYSSYKEDFNTGSMIVDSILRNKKSLCEEKSINFDVNVDFSKSEFIDMIDSCIIFSNIIDNAIEACDKITSTNLCKSIKLDSKYINQFCIILIKNTKSNEVLKMNNDFLTSKNGHSMHGIGLKNVKKSVEKYSGKMLTDYSNNEFVVKIMIPCDFNLK